MTKAIELSQLGSTLSVESGHAGFSRTLFVSDAGTFDPPGEPGEDTSSNTILALTTGNQIAGVNAGYIRTLFKWTSGGDIGIGQGGTSLINGINLQPGSSGLAKVNGNTIWHGGNDNELVKKSESNVLTNNLQINTDTNTKHLIITRSGALNQAVKVGLTDGQLIFDYTNDESFSSVKYRLNNTDTEQHSGANASVRNIILAGDSVGASISIGDDVVIKENVTGTTGVIDVNHVNDQQGFAEQHQTAAPFYNTFTQSGSQYQAIVKGVSTGASNTYHCSFGVLHNSDGTQNLALHGIRNDGTLNAAYVFDDQQGGSVLTVEATGDFRRRISSQSANVGPGWVSVATCTNSRKHSEIIVSDQDSADHALVKIDWLRSFQDTSFTVINAGGHGNRITGVRVLNEDSNITYGTKILQVYVTVQSNYTSSVYRTTIQPGYTDHTVLTPVVENTKTGYSLQGNEVTDLDDHNFASEQGMRAGGKITTKNTFFNTGVLYSANQDHTYLVAGTEGWTGATTNWNTFGFQHRIKSDSGGVPRITIDGPGGEFFTVLNGGNIGIGTDNPSTKLDVRGHIKVDNASTLSDGGSTSLRVSTSYGYLNIGPQNGSYCHVATDRSRFYFNKKLIVDEGIIASYNEDLKLNTSISSTRLTIKTSNGYVGINNTNPASMLDVVGTMTFAGGAFNTNVTYGGRSIQTTVDIKATSMRGGILVRNMNDYRSETDSASFMHYDAYDTTANSYAFRVAAGATLADKFYVKNNGDTYVAGSFDTAASSLEKSLIAQGIANSMGWIPGYSNNNYSEVYWDFAERAVKLHSTTDNAIGMVKAAIPVKPDQTIRATITVKVGDTTAGGLYLRLAGISGNLPDGKTHVIHNASANPDHQVEDEYHVTNWLENGTNGSGWKTYEKDYTVPNALSGAIYYFSLYVLNWTAQGTNPIWVKDASLVVLN